MNHIKMKMTRIALALALTAGVAVKANAFTLNSLELKDTLMTSCSPATSICLTIRAQRSVESSFGQIVYFYNPTIEFSKLDGTILQVLKPSGAYLNNDWKQLVLKDIPKISIPSEIAINLKAIKPVPSSLHRAKGLSL